MPGKKGATHYSVETKQEAIRLYFNEDFTYREITERLAIRDPERVKKWVKDYRRGGSDLFTRHLGRPRKVMEGEKTYIARLEMENKLLKKLQSELLKDTLAKRDIGQSIITKENTQ
jgi:transposase